MNTVLRGVESPWAEEAEDIVRAFAGGFLFGVPLLYTMEMWWFGTYVSPPWVLVALGLALGLNFVLVHYAGFKKTTTLPSSILDAIEAVAIGIVAATVVLLVLDRIRFGDPLYVVTATIIVEAIPFSIGASVANSLLKPGGAGRKGEGQKGTENESETSATLQDVGATTVGAVFIALTVAPTAEIPMLAFQMTPFHEGALVILTLLVTYAIVFEAGFSDWQKRRQERGLFQSPFAETVLSYLVALAVSVILLALFQRISATESWTAVYSQVIVLGFPAAIGGAAGRLVG